MSSSASCRSVLASVATHPGAPRAYVLCQSLSKRSVSPPWLRTTTSSWIRLAMNFSSSLPSKTWFTHRALSFRLFFLFFFFGSGAILLHRTQEGAFPTEPQNFGLFLCYLFLAFAEAEVTEASSHRRLFHLNTGTTPGSFQDPVSLTPSPQFLPHGWGSPEPGRGAQR